ncbi:uncharacterized protein LOC131984472 [Centropristis striata]|uniref:uncharacterized protein LOC131984472 n=1 Tax=Centropristis striata TaxID=184440 RepID=UPI0027E03FD4|nr:uncharacterized protein LOC131984472 [Centropristis striata]
MEMQRRQLTPEEDALEHIVPCRDKPFLEERFIDSFKGRGVFTHKAIKPSSFVVEYRGNVFRQTDAPQRKYDEPLNNYLFEFTWDGAQWCVDASKEDRSLGRLVNDNHISPNCEIRTVVCEGKPHLCLFAVMEISQGEEITYNYGDSSYPWRSMASCEGSSTSYPDFYTASSTPRNERLQDSPASSFGNSFSDEDDYVQPDSEPSRDGASFADINTQLDFRDTSPFADSSKEMMGSFVLPPDEASFTQQEDDVSSDGDEGTSEATANPDARSWTSKNYCYVCGKGYSKLARHFVKHADQELEIAEALALPKTSRERKKILDELRNWGNYLHNKEVLKSKSGELKLKRRPKTGEVTTKTFVHCLHCKGMFRRKEIWRHVSRCPSRTSGNSETSNSATGGHKKVLGEIALAESPYTKNLQPNVREILLNMNQDLIASAVQNDFLLIQLAQYLSEKYGNDPSKHEYVRQKLREMGRLLLALHEKSIYSFEEAIKPKNFNKVVDAVKVLAGFDQKMQGYNKPSLALKIGHSLKKLGNIVLNGDNCNERKMKDTKTFMKLCTKEWSEQISHTALASLNGRRVNKPSTIQFTRDVQAFFRYLEKTSASAVESMKTSESQQVYTALCRVTLAQATVLSKCAPEVSKMTLKTFQERDDSTQVLSKHFLRMNIVFKSGKNVAVLLTSQLVSALTLLVSKRSTCGVHDANPFLFAKPNSSPVSLFHGGNCIRAFSSLCRAKSPEHLRSVHHHKHIARIFQILNLENDELDRLAKLLGQDIRADRDYYRLPEAAVELAKISKLLLAMEKGSLEKFKGNSLDDIEIEDELEPDVEQVIPENCYTEDNEESEDLVQQSDAAEQQGNHPTPEQDALEHVKACRDKPFLEERFIDPIKGRGVFTCEAIEPSSFVVEFRGNISRHKETMKQKQQDALNDYVFDFSWNKTFWQIDASSEDGTLGRLVNDDHISPNCVVKTVVCEEKPHLCLFAVTEISPGDEITFNYGDSSYPWRSKECTSELNPSPTEENAAASPPEDENAEDSCCDDDFAPSTSNQQRQSSSECDSSDDFNPDEEVKNPSFTSKNYCFVCGAAQSKISRHLLTHRKEVPEIAQLLKLRKNSKERKRLYSKLRDRGNNKHNQEVLKNRSGELKVKRRKSNKHATAAVFRPCRYCQGMYTRADMGQHLNKCPARQFSRFQTRGKTQILDLVDSAESTDPQNMPADLRKMLETLKDDEISSEVWNDSLILQLAQCLYKATEKKNTRCEKIKDKVRQMGRLLFILKKKSICSMEEAIKPENFSKVVEAVKELTGFNDQSKSCAKISVMRFVGFCLKKIGDINFARALKENADKETMNKAQEYMMLCAKEWNSAPSSKVNTIPFVQDVQLFFQCLEKTAVSGVESLRMYVCAPVYTALLRVTVARVSVLNKNMPEVSKSTLKSFKERDEAEDAAVSQSPLEQILNKHIVKINLMNQSDQKIPVTLTSDLLTAITLLVDKREACGIHAENPFLFGRPEASSSSFYHGHQCVSVFASRCGAKNTSNLRPPLHKHILRVFQILSLTNDELDQLAKLLGRDIQTDREFYQTPEAAADIAKISELLSAAENGSLEKFEGKSLEEIEIPDELELDVEQPNEESLLLSGLPFTKGTASKPKKKKKSRKKKPESEDDDFYLDDEVNTERDDWSEEQLAGNAPEDTASRGNEDATRMSFSDGDDDMNVDFDVDMDTDEDIRNEERNGDTTKENDDSRAADPEDVMDFNAVNNSETQDQKKGAEQNNWMDVNSRSSSDKLMEEKKKKLLAAVAGMKQAKILLEKLDIVKYQASVKSPVQDDNNLQNRRSSKHTNDKQSYAKATEMNCSFCRSIMMKGQTAYQKKGFTDVFCSKNCLFQMFPIVKTVTKTCHYCIKSISQPADLIMAAVDNKGTMKDFCSVTCLISFKSDSVPTTCSMCNKACTSTCELILNETVHPFCSDPCLQDFHRENVDVCENCSLSLLKRLMLRLKLEDGTKAICKQDCLDEFKENITTPHQCTMCHSLRPVSNMVGYKNEENIVTLFCTRNCVTSYKLGLEFANKSTDEKSSGTMSKRKRGRPKKILSTVEECGEETVNTENENIVTDSAVSEHDAPAAVIATSDTITRRSGSFCCKCGKHLPDGEMMYCQKNKKDVFCSKECVFEKQQMAKLVTKTCYNCLQVITRPQKLIMAPVDDSGTMKELCSSACLSSVNSKRKATALKAKCKMCSKVSSCKSRMTVDGSLHIFCSNACFIHYHRANNLPVSLCDVCSCVIRDNNTNRFMLKADDGTKIICSDECLVKYKENIEASRPCPMCQTSHQLSDMVEGENQEGMLDFFCSNRCMMVHKAQSSSVSGRNSPPSENNDIKEVKPSPSSEEFDFKEGKPSKTYLDFIKEEPVDEGYSQNPPSSVSTENIKDEPKAGDDSTKDDLKIDSVFSLTGGSSSATSTAQLLTQVDFPAPCSNCKQVLLDGETVYQRKDHADIFCSTSCLLTFYQKTQVKRTCSFCLQGMSQTQEVLQVPGDEEGTMKDFCSVTCLSSFNYKKIMSTKIQLAPVTSQSQCSMCSRYCISKREIIQQDSVHKVCSDPCFLRFCNLNNLTICENCRSCCDSPLLLRMEDGCKKLCSAECLAKFKQTIKTLQPCAMCRISFSVPDMFENKSSEDVVELFCTRSCVIASKIQASGTPLSCDQCGKNQLPACHLAMSDASIRNFCTLTCAMSFKDAQKDTSAATNSTGAADQTQNDFHKPPEKLPCAQCQRAIKAAPKVIQRKGKINFVCSVACSEEFKKVDNLLGKCEYCKKKKIVSDVKKVDGKERYFCSDGCLVLFRRKLEKEWGDHCGSCAYCFCISRTLVTAKCDGADEKFCSEECSSNYSTPHCRVAKCDTCGRDGKLRQRLPLLGEVKHFCDLRCLLHFCNKKVQMGNTVSSPPRPSDTVDSSPVIENVISLAGALAMRPGASDSSTQHVSDPDIQTKVVGHASVQTVPTQLKNKSMLCTPLVHNKGVSCTTQTVDTQTQTDKTKSVPKLVVLPVPVPVYIPLPLNMYSQYTPTPLGLPLPLPVPVFLPEPTVKSMKETVELELLQGEAGLKSEVKKARRGETRKRDDRVTTGEAQREESYALKDCSDDLDSNHQETFSNQDDSDVSSASHSRLHTHENPPPLFLEIIGSAEPQPDLLPPPPAAPAPPLSKQTFGKIHNKNKRRKLHQSSTAAKEGKLTSRTHGELQSRCGIDAWKRWIQWRNSHSKLDLDSPRAETLNEDVLRCSAVELNNSLCCFITEVKRPDGEPYSPDSLFYLCLGIQQFLFENGRLENIFSDLIYSKFSTHITKILKGFKPSAGGSCVEEEFLWDCKQLGAYSPIILVNTLLFFCCKHFGFTTVEQHRRLSFAHVACCTKTNPNNSKTTFLRFYHPMSINKGESDADGVPAKKRKKTEGKEDFLEMMENTENPLCCPVRLYEFYLSKCPESVRRRSDLFYLRPDVSCVSSSPLWFSSAPMDAGDVEAALVRSLAVRELQEGDGGDGGGAERQTSPLGPDEEDSE